MIQVLSFHKYCDGNEDYMWTSCLLVLGYGYKNNLLSLSLTESTI